MTSFSIARFCYFVFSFFSATLFLSCKTEIIVQKDPGIISPGDYKLTGTASYTINGAVSSSPVSGTLSVFAGNSSDTYYFLEKIKGFNQLGYQATRLGEKFIVEGVYDYSTYKNVNYYGKQSGGGVFSSAKIELDRTAQTDLVAMNTPTGDKIAYRMPIQKRVSYTAAK